MSTILAWWCWHFPTSRSIVHWRYTMRQKVADFVITWSKATNWLHLCPISSKTPRASPTPQKLMEKSNSINLKKPRSYIVVRFKPCFTALDRNRDKSECGYQESAIFSIVSSTPGSLVCGQGLNVFCVFFFDLLAKYQLFEKCFEKDNGVTDSV